MTARGAKQLSPRTIATFVADRFNSTEQRDNFINPDNYGEDRK